MAHLLLAGLLLATPVAGAATFQRLCAEPLDVSGSPSFRLPDFLRAIKQADGVAYPGHWLLGTLLGRANCAPTAVAVQWSKAAWHARSTRELDTSVAWLRRAAARVPEERLSAEVCPRTFRPSDPHAVQQMQALSAAGLTCHVQPVR